MTDDSLPLLSDDERTLAGYAEALGDAIEAVAGDWMIRAVDSRARGLSGSAKAEELIAAGTAEMMVELRELLAQDIADQASGPLEVVRRAVRIPSQILADASVPVVQRDDFSQRNFPDDVYNLTPASFADIDPSLHEPGLMWGAAKAHVHLRRRRQS